MDSSRIPFLFGAATSAHQIEGQNRHSDWWDWEAKGKIAGGVVSGDATGHWKRFKEDLRLARELGLNSYRFSIEWAKIEPEEGRWDEEALDWYLELVSECERLGLLPMATLHHFSSPLWFACDGGFTNPLSVLRFERFTKKVLEKLGSRIPLWCTLNEPMVLAIGSYLGGFMPPGIQDPCLASRALSGLYGAHEAAYSAIHSMSTERQGPWKAHPLGVGIAHNMLDFVPARAFHPIDQLLTRVLHRFYNCSWLEGVTGRRNSFSLWPILPKSDAWPMRGASADFIGVNYYTKAYVRFGRDPASSLPFSVSFSRDGELSSDLGWAFHPKGFKKCLKLASSYGLPVYVTENGIADSVDSRRAEYLKQHLAAIKELIQEGLPIRGYYYWSLVDNFEWSLGFEPRFGLYSVDYSSQERTLRASARVLSEAATSVLSIENGVQGPRS